MNQAKRHILPFFIPMLGCVSHCVYCDQYSISGQAEMPSPGQIEREALAYAGTCPGQLAFYGGSFTALPWKMQEAYLQAVQPAFACGRIDSIRVSTRPDAISSEAVDRLAAYGVTTVELGIQSFDAEVLKASGRAYSSDTACRSCELVRAAGLTLGIQLMTGLPLDSRQKSLRSMAQGCDMGADFFRIYPTLVLRNTALAIAYEQELYQPQELAEAAQLAADLLALALERGCPVIRLGLNPSPSLEKALVSGPYHPAFGQIARGALKLQQALLLLEQAGGKPLALRYPARERPLLFGQKNEQWQMLQGLYGGLSVQADDGLPLGSLQALPENAEAITLNQDEFLKYYVGLLRAQI